MCWNKNKRLLLAFLFLYWLVFNYFVLHTPFSIFPAPQGQVIEAMAVAESDAEGPGSVSFHSENLVTLPDDWYQRRVESSQFWYHAELELSPASAALWGVYLPSVTHNAAVYINGIWVGQGGDFGDPVSRHHNDPLLFDFASGLLQEGTNTLHIRVKASYQEQGLLDKVYVAPLEQLLPAYERKRFLRVDFIRWITMAMYFMSAIVFCFWFARRQDVVYGLFALQLAIWASHNLNLFVNDIPTPAHFWEAMTMSTLGWIVVAMIFFNHRYVGGGSRRVEQFALVFGVLGLGIFFLPDIGMILSIGYGVWDSFLIVFGSYAIIHLLKVFWRRPDPDIYFMLLVGIPILVFGFHDILVVNNLRDRTEGLVIQYSVIPAILLFSWFLIRRFVQSVNQAENLAETLEQRVIEKQNELSLQYEQLKVLERKNVLSEERERIMRDMHDGIGGQLVSVATMLQEHQGDVFDQLREKVQLSLVDLRFVIDSLDPVLNDLPTLLGMVRSRLADQLNAAGIELEWAVTELPEVQGLSPRRCLHVMRIIQEVFANAIKHSEARHLSLATKVSACDGREFVVIEMTDDGRGIDPHSLDQKPGRGIRNMRYRAQQLQGRLEIEPLEQGTRVSLLIPLVMAP